MELKKWMAVVTIGLDITGGLMIGGAGPATAPSAQPAATPAPMQTDNQRGTQSDNQRGSRQRGGGGRTRGGGNRDSANVLPVGADPYSILSTRSIFVKGDQRIAGDVRANSGTQVQPGYFYNSPRSSLIFNGVILVNDEADALIEDSGSGNVVRVRPGDPIAGGKVTIVTFDDLSYEVGGKTKHVEIGQTLEGQSPSYASSSSAPPSTMPTTMPAGAFPPGAMQMGGVTPTGPGPGGASIAPPGISTGNMSPEDILARLKARRAAESGGK